MREGEQLYFRSEQRRKLLEVESSVVKHRNKPESRSCAFRQQLPWNQIAVMFHDGQKNYVAFTNEYSAPCLCHKINALSRAAREDDFVRASRADVICDALPRVFVSFGRPRA